MKMSNLEKLFVNSPSHSRQVIQHTDNLLQRAKFAAGQKYLDVGCGNGAAPTYVAVKHGLEVTGVDVDPEQIAFAQANSQDVPNVHYLTIDGTDLPFDDGEFDIVFTNKVMHHIPNWQDAVMEMIRVLKTGGYLIYSDLVFPGPIAKLGQAIVGKHSGFPTRQGLDELVTQHHLTAIHLSVWPVHYEGVFQK